MSKILGSVAVFVMNAVTISTFINQTDFQRVVDLLDSHTFGDAAKEVVPGLTDATCSVSGLYDDVAADIDARMNTAFTDADGFVVSIYPVGTAAGKQYYTGTAFMRNYGIGLNVAELETFSFDLQFSGGASRSTV